MSKDRPRARQLSGNTHLVNWSELNCTGQRQSAHTITQGCQLMLCVSHYDQLFQDLESYSQSQK